MAGKSDAWEDGLLNLLFRNETFAAVGDGTGLVGSGTPGSLFVSLHTGDPTDSGDQTSNETVYTDYVRVAVARPAGWTQATGGAGVTSPAADIDFIECGATPGAAVTYFGIGTLTSGAGALLYSGLLSPSITMAEGVIPRIKSTSTVTET
jgi:hypothetical protein